MTFKIAKFTFFSCNDRVSAEEHLVRFNCHCREAADNEFLKLRMFCMSLTQAVFWWYTNLPPNSIHSWQDMQVQFTNHFSRTEPGVTLSFLARIQ